MSGYIGAGRTWGSRAILSQFSWESISKLFKCPSCPKLSRMLSHGKPGWEGLDRHFSSELSTCWSLIWNISQKELWGEVEFDIYGQFDQLHFACRSLVPFFLVTVFRSLRCCMATFFLFFKCSSLSHIFFFLFAWIDTFCVLSDSAETFKPYLLVYLIPKTPPDTFTTLPSVTLNLSFSIAPAVYHGQLWFVSTLFFYEIWVFSVFCYCCCLFVSFATWCDVFLLDDDRLDDKDSVDIHDNPPLPDNVVKEEDNTVNCFLHELFIQALSQVK